MYNMEIRKIPTSMQMAMNTYVYFEQNPNSEEKEGFVIDVGYRCEKVLEFIKENNINIKAILLTHAHADHIGGIEMFKKEYDVPVYAFEDTENFANNASNNLSNQFPGGSITITADKHLKDNDVIEIGKTFLKVIHTPGHSPESCCYYNPEFSTLFSGDTLFEESIGRTDFPLGNSELLTKSIREKLFTLPDDTTIHPGHGGYSTIGHERTHNVYV